MIRYILCLIIVHLCCYKSNLAQQGSMTLRGESFQPTSLTQYVHRAWGIEHGLPQNTLSSLCQTRDGYIWFGTAEGLVCFDGVRFTMFTSNSTPALSHNFISSVMEDSTGALWITTFGGGINRLARGKISTWTTEQGLPHNSARISLDAGDGKVWVGTNRGVGILQDSKVQVLSKLLDSAVVTVLFKDSQGRVWIGTRNQSLFLFEKGVLTPFLLHTSAHEPPPLHIREIIEASNGELWVATLDGLYCIQQSTITSYTTREGLPSNQVQALMIDTYGSLWIGTQSGFCRMNANMVSIFPENHSLRDVAITSLLEDAERNIWVGTYGHGLHRLHEGKIFVYPEQLTLQNQNVLSIAEARNSLLVMGTTNGLFLLNPASPKESVRIDATKSLAVYALLPEKAGRIWLGSANGVQYLNIPSEPQTSLQRFANTRFQGSYVPDAVVLSFAKDSAGRLWIGTQNKGLLCLENGVVTRPPAVAELRGEIVSSLYTARDGTLWITTWNGGLWSLKNNTCKHFTEENGMRSSQVLCTLEDSEGTLWFGTFGGGIHRLKNGVMTRLTMAQGLANDVAYSLLEDTEGNIWSSFGQGIIRMTKSSMNACAEGKLLFVQSKVFGMNDGMKSSETSSGTQPVAWRCQDGSLLFATVRGIAEVVPKRFRENILPPKVRIEHLQADTMNITTDAAVEDHINLDAATQRIEFGYTATSLVDPSKVRFRIMLEGYDANWVEAKERRVAFYTNLPRGREYCFRVLACNNDGVWNEVGATLRFRVQSFWWETWWAYSIYAVLGGFGLRQIARYREKVQRQRLREKFREREAELIFEKNQVLEEANTSLASLNGQLSEANEHLVQLNEEKVDILGVVAHDLKNPIIGIQKMAYSLEGQARRLESPQMLESASIIKRTSERMFAMIQQLLKVHAAEYGKESLIPTTINVGELLEQLRHDWQQRAKLRSVEICTIFPDEPVIAFADPMAVLQVVENLLSNAMKASHLNSKVELHCRIESGKAVIVVKDFGFGMNEEQQQMLFTKHILLRGAAKAGLPTEEYSSGLGLYIVRKLTDAMNGEIRCESAVNRGSTFTVILPTFAPTELFQPSLSKKYDT